MPRDSGGLYGLPPGNPVVPFTTIESDWANPTMSDVGQELTDSLSRSGKGGMLASLRGLDGSAAVPAWSWTNEPSTGRYRAGPGQVVESVLGQPVVRYLATGLEQWDSDTMSWIPLTPRDALGTPFDPAPSNLTSTNVQDAIEEVNNKSGGIITADSVSYDDSAVYFPATTVQQAIDRIGADIPGLANDILDNSDAILIVEGDLILLTNRVTQVEITANNNTNDIALHDTRITANTNDINTERGRVDSIELEQITQNSNIQTNFDYASFLDGVTQANAADITTNATQIGINAANISGNATQIGINAGNISDNADAIQINANDLQAFNSIFPGGVLLVANGGTGVQTSTGTGSTVRNNGPTFTGSPTANTPATSSNSTQIATTAFVKNQNYDEANCQISATSNSNGNYSAVRNFAINGNWQVVQWGRKVVNVSPGTQITLPLALGNGNNYQVSLQSFVGTGSVGTDTAARVDQQYSSNFVAVNSNWTTEFITTGWLAYSAIFAAIPLSGDRYYHKVLKTEWIEQLHGPAGPEPDVVVLPPGNTFWGDPLDVDEVLTYDIDDLPLARVVRVKPVSEIIGGLLGAAGLDATVFRRALVADSRGIPADLVAFNAALDIVIAANPYTEAQFLENL